MWLVAPALTLAAACDSPPDGGLEVAVPAETVRQLSAGSSSADVVLRNTSRESISIGRCAYELQIDASAGQWQKARGSQELCAGGIPLGGGIEITTTLGLDPLASGKYRLLFPWAPATSVSAMTSPTERHAYSNEFVVTR
jgi:hypothetical protein